MMVKQLGKQGPLGQGKLSLSFGKLSLGLGLDLKLAPMLALKREDLIPRDHLRLFPPHVLVWLINTYQIQK